MKEKDPNSQDDGPIEDSSCAVHVFRHHTNQKAESMNTIYDSIVVKNAKLGDDSCPDADFFSENRAESLLR